MPRSLSFLGAAAALSLFAACSANPGGSDGTAGDGGTAGNGGSSTNQGGGGNTGQGGDTGIGGLGGLGPGSGGANPTGGNTCQTDPAADEDKDGFSVNDGDCNDCDVNVGPGSIEVKITEPGMDGKVPDPADEDCDGTIDNVPAACDDNLAIADNDPFHGANAIDLCQKAGAGDKKWGVIEAKYVRANGSSATPPNALQHGLMSKFGSNVNVQGGKSMLALSAGNARDANDPSPCGTQSCHPSQQGTAPPNFPQAVCNASDIIFDDVALDLKIRAPKNATGYSFNFKFQSFEYSEWVCTPYNDQFIALVTPPPPGSINGNISFDSKNNPVSVNIGFFDVCSPESCDPSIFASNCFSGCPSPPVPCCPSGPGDLAGTGFDTWGDAGATSWLKTQAPVKGGETINVRFTIWDAGDQNLDSTVLVDNFQWVANGGTVAIGTVEIPDPK
jgi:hypothetical protein